MKAAVATFVLFLATTLPLYADPIRIALFNTELSQEGPGLLQHRLEQASLPQAEAVIDVILSAKPDILILQDFDWDLEKRALSTLQSRLLKGGLKLPHAFTARPNSGLQTDLDMDGDGRKGGPRDAQGYGAFTGAHGMAVLSRFPLSSAQLTDFTAALWVDFDWADLPIHADGSAFPSAEAQNLQRLSSTNHWLLPVEIAQGVSIDLMIFNPTPPVFDGAEDRNGKRNHDEIEIFTRLLSGMRGIALPNPVIVVGDANLDPTRGDGRHEAINRLLKHPRLQDPTPQSRNAGLATVDWQSTGPLRVDYILPDTALVVRGAAVLWPTSQDDPAAHASRHRLLWVDVELP